MWFLLKHHLLHIILFNELTLELFTAKRLQLEDSSIFHFKAFLLYLYNSCSGQLSTNWMFLKLILGANGPPTGIGSRWSQWDLV